MMEYNTTFKISDKTENGKRQIKVEDLDNNEAPEFCREMVTVLLLTCGQFAQQIAHSKRESKKGYSCKIVLKFTDQGQDIVDLAISVTDEMGGIFAS